MTQSTTSERIGLTLTPETAQLAPGTVNTIDLAVTNRGPIVDQFALAVQGLDPNWFSVTEGTVNLFPGATGRLQIALRLPLDAGAPAGRHEAVLTVVSRETPDLPAIVTLPIDVLAVGGVQVSLTPRRMMVGRRATARYGVALVNHSNADMLVDLVARDADTLLDLHVTPDRLAVRGGAGSEATVTARPRERPWLGAPHSYQFTVEVIPAPAAEESDALVSEPVAAASGELVYRPPLAVLAALPARWKRLAMGLAALAVAAALLIWFLAAPGRRGALIERFPPAKPLVAAVENALSLPDKVASEPELPATTVAEAPFIKRFELATPGQDQRLRYGLVWEVDRADTVKINGAEQANPSSGSFDLDTLENAEYLLEATRGGVTVSQSVGVVILRPPDIRELSGSPETIELGQSAVLQWQAVRGDRANLDDQPVEPAGGSRRVSPTVTTAYTLTVENELGRTERTVQVRVVLPTATPTP